MKIFHILAHQCFLPFLNLLTESKPVKSDVEEQRVSKLGEREGREMTTNSRIDAVAAAPPLQSRLLLQNAAYL